MSIAMRVELACEGEGPIALTSRGAILTVYKLGNSGIKTWARGS
jgi:hypothetical protein